MAILYDLLAVPPGTCFADNNFMNYETQKMVFRVHTSGLLTSLWRCSHIHAGAPGFVVTVINYRNSGFYNATDRDCETEEKANSPECIEKVPSANEKFN